MNSAPARIVTATNRIPITTKIAEFLRLGSGNEMGVGSDTGGGRTDGGRSGSGGMRTVLPKPAFGLFITSVPVGENGLVSTTTSADGVVRKSSAGIGAGRLGSASGRTTSQPPSRPKPARR